MTQRSFPLLTATAKMWTLVFTVCWFSIPAFAAIRYVKPAPAGTGDGSSWANASAGLQAMINASASGDQVWVAAGTYKTTTGTDRTISFSMKNGVAILGGFPDTGDPDLDDRDWVANVTTLSGEIGAAGNSDNAYHVIRNISNGLDNSAVLDGFTVTGGSANGSSALEQDRGGGIYNFNTLAPAVTNCTFTGNSASIGAGMYNSVLSSPKLTNCTFHNNSATSNGGGIYNSTRSDPAIINCIFTNNTASGTGGGIANYFFSAPVLFNCTLSGNTAGAGGAISSNSSTPSLTNCIVWGNSSGIFSTATVAYSIVQGGYAGTGNLNADPLFADAANGNLQLQTCSPGIDAGTNTGAPATDFYGNARPFNASGKPSAVTDMGAYEHSTAYDGCTLCLTSGNIVYVKASAAGANNGKSWTDAFTDLQAALVVANTCSDVTDIWVAAGTYKPTTGADRNISFSMVNGVSILGGFPDTGNPDLDDRDWVANVTTLSGDIGAAGNSDNAYHVIQNYSNGVTNSAVLDGFTITGGNSNHFGGGMYNRYASPSIANCIFKGNTTTSYGGGLGNELSSSPKLTNCVFIGNTASAGGGLFNTYSSDPVLTNCSFSGNSATTAGAVYNYFAGAATMQNCIVWGNSSGIVNGIGSDATVTYSIVQGGYTGTGNLNVDPLFVSQPAIGLDASGDLHLQACSPAIDAGDNTGAPTSDLDGNTRPFNATDKPEALADLGAYEYGTAYDVCSTCLTSGNVVYVNANAAGANNGKNWTDAFSDLQSALDMAGACHNVSEIWVAAGTYKPSVALVDIGGEVGIEAREITFQLREGIQVYGGFAGTETLLSERDPAAHLTTLSGDVGTVNEAGDNAYHVVYTKNVTDATVLDGFTITGGNANNGSYGSGNQYNYDGGGMLIVSGSPLVNNCIFTQNTAFGGGAMANISSSPHVTNSVFRENSANAGGAIINDGQGAMNPVYENCVFNNNTSRYYGGAVSDFGDKFTAINCIFSENSASPAGGGAVYTEAADHTYINCTFLGNSTPSRGGAVQLIAGTHTFLNCVVSGNSSGSYGGGLYIEQSSNVNIINCTVSGNKADSGGGIYIGEDPSNKIINTIVWNNQDATGIGTPSSSVVTYEGTTAITYSLIQGQNPAGTGNKDGTTAANNPAFVTPVSPATAPTLTGDLHLQDCSPAIDAGDDAANTSTEDADGNPRTVDAYAGGAQIDLGAYEAAEGDIELPTIVCPANINVGTAPNQCTALATYTAPVGTDNCAGATTAKTDGTGLGSGSIFPSGVSTLQYTVTDAHNGSASCSFTVTVSDNQLPAITCPPAVVVTCATNIPAVNLNAVSASDNCGPVTKSHAGDSAPYNQTCANRFKINRTYKAQDGSANSKTCVQTITVSDYTAPVLSNVPANVTVQCNNVPPPGAPTASDGCGGTLNIVYLETRTNGACTDTYTLTRKWTASDACGNTKTATQKITVRDTQKPVFTAVPQNLTLQCSDPVPSPANAMATDNCDSEVAVVFLGQSAGNAGCQNSYQLFRTWKATDKCGNSTVATQTITIQDTQAPSFTSVPNDVTIQCSNPVPSIGQTTATDACAGYVQITFLGQTSTAGDCPQEYTITRSWRAQDLCGNSVTASQVITIIDTQAPNFTNAPANVTVNCPNIPGVPTLQATDACGMATVTYLGQTQTPGDCASGYAVTRTWSAADPCGNVQTHTQTITVLGSNYEDGTESRAAVNLQPSTVNRLSVYPNPTTDRIRIDLSDFAGEAVTVSIFSDLGQLVWENRILAVEDLNLQVSLREAGAAAGMYSVRVQNNAGVMSKRLLLVE